MPCPATNPTEPLARDVGDARTAQKNDAKQNQQHHRADESELLGEHGKDEVGRTARSQQAS